MDTEKKDSIINIRVLGQDNSAITFKVRRDAHLKKLMDAYCIRVNVQKLYIRFLYNGIRIKDKDTPNSLEMDDEVDEIEVMPATDGGFFQIL